MWNLDASTSRRRLLTMPGLAIATSATLAACGGGDDDPPPAYPLSENAVTLAYEEAGDPSKPTLLLVHGGTATRRAWDLVTPGLLTRFRIVSVDMRGHGQSPVTNTGYSAAQLSADLNRVVQTLGLTHVTVFGHSIGGMAALYLAARRPDAIQRVIVMDTPVTPNTIAAVTGLNAFVQSAGFYPLSPAFVDQWNTYAQPVPDWFLASQKAQTIALPEVVWKQLINEVATADISAILPLVKQPTLVLWGGQDGLLNPQQYAQLQAGIPNTRLVVIAEAGHNPNYETPARVVTEVIAFAG